MMHAKQCTRPLLAKRELFSDKKMSLLIHKVILMLISRKVPVRSTAWPDFTTLLNTVIFGEHSGSAWSHQLASLIIATSLSTFIACVSLELAS